MKYFIGDGVVEDIEKAFEYAKRSAELGDPYGCFLYGNLLSKEAMKYFKMAADLGNSDGMLHFGIGLSTGWLEEPNLIEAMKYFKMASDLGNSKAMDNYLNGLSKGWLAKTNRAYLNRAHQRFSSTKNFGRLYKKRR